MLKLTPFSLVVCLALTGCQMFKRSATWDTVTRFRAEAPAAGDPSSAYAEELHRVLLRDGVPHRVVNYSYFGSQRFEESTGARTAVIYEDHTSSGSPFWLMDDQLSRPLWLPDADLETQLRFYVRSKNVIGITSKTYLTNSAPSEARPTVRERPEPRPTGVTHITPAREYPQPATPALCHQDSTHEASGFDAFTLAATAPFRYVVAHLSGKPAHDTTPPAPVTVEERHPKRKPAKHAADTHHETAAPEHRTIEPTLGGNGSHPTNEEIFRREHGTVYDPASPTDRRKMEKIKRTARR